MREIVILLLVVALLVLAIGAVNQDQQVDLDYVFGTWENVSVLSLSAVAAGSAVVLGLVIAAMARLRVVADRRKLERELQLVYPRLREAERAAGLPAWNLPVEAVVAPPAAETAVDGVGAVGVGSTVVTATPPPPLAAADSVAEPTAIAAPPVATGDPQATEAAETASETAAAEAAEPAAEGTAADATAADPAAAPEETAAERRANGEA